MEILQSDWSVDGGRIREGRIWKSCSLIGQFAGKDSGFCDSQFIFREGQEYLPSKLSHFNEDNTLGMGYWLRSQHGHGR